MRFKDAALYATALLLGALAMAGCWSTGTRMAEKWFLKVEWAGMPMVSDGGEGWGHLANVEMGLRADGIVVWRLKAEK